MNAESALHAAHISSAPSRTVTSPSMPSPRPNRSRKGSKLAVAACPGYRLVFPEGQNHFGSYPFGLHVTRTLPWSFIITNDNMTLHSDDCANTPRYHKNSADPLPCSWCRVLHFHTIIMEIRHRAINGSHENTPWQYLLFIELIQILERKNNQLERLNLNGLNMGRVLAVSNRTVGGYK